VILDLKGLSQALSPETMTMTRTEVYEHISVIVLTNRDDEPH
jgi:hypothetical protein